MVVRVAKRFPQPQSEAELSETEPPAKRKKTLKKLAKENHKVTDWLNPKPKPSIPTVVVASTATQEEVIEMEILEEAAQPEKRCQEGSLDAEGDGHQAAGGRGQEHSWNLSSEGSDRGCAGDGMVENGTKCCLEYAGRQ